MGDHPAGPETPAPWGRSREAQSSQRESPGHPPGPQGRITRRDELTSPWAGATRLALGIVLGGRQCENADHACGLPAASQKRVQAYIKGASGGLR